MARTPGSISKARDGRSCARSTGRLGLSPRVDDRDDGEACAAPKDTLPTIFPGSWINADFYIWIGHADDQRAWSQLADARRALESASGVLPMTVARAPGRKC